MSKVVEKAEELQKDVETKVEEVKEELQEMAADPTDSPKKKQVKLGAVLRKYGIPALAFGLGWFAKTCWNSFTGSSVENGVDAGNVVDMPVAGTDSTTI